MFIGLGHRWLEVSASTTFLYPFLPSLFTSNHFSPIFSFPWTFFLLLSPSFTHHTSLPSLPPRSKPKIQLDGLGSFPAESAKAFLVSLSQVNVSGGNSCSFFVGPKCLSEPGKPWCWMRRYFFQKSPSFRILSIYATA